MSVTRQALSSNPPDSDCTFDTYNGHEYFFCRNDRNWQQARDKCLAVGGDLAIVETAAENDYIQTALTESSWIGATDESVEGQWIWAKTSEQFWSGGFNGHTVGGSYENWASFQPDRRV
ncbi:MAG: C-type lectin domain-containing protein [Deltaproteobacteria bacterium]|nr:C-type lectin domain-containing protein [Deltaproteobacteria bacterium]